MKDDHQHDIFLSYAREDVERVEKLVPALEALGWSVFWDLDIPPGTTWAVHIGGELEKARCVVVAWSGASIDSMWVQEEAREGAERKILVPVQFELVKPPFGFGGIQAVDLVSWEGDVDATTFQRLVKGVERILGRAPRHKQAEERPRREQEEKERRREAEVKMKRHLAAKKGWETRRKEAKAESQRQAQEEEDRRAARARPEAKAKTVRQRLEPAGARSSRREVKHDQVRSEPKSWQETQLEEKSRTAKVQEIVAALKWLRRTRRKADLGRSLSSLPFGSTKKTRREESKGMPPSVRVGSASVHLVEGRPSELKASYHSLEKSIDQVPAPLATRGWRIQNGSLRRVWIVGSRVFIAGQPRAVTSLEEIARELYLVIELLQPGARQGEFFHYRVERNSGFG